MPRISTFMYCEETKQEAHPGLPNRLNISNPLNVFRPAFVPGMFSFSIVFGLLGIDIVEKQHLLRIKFLNSNDLEKPIIDTGDIQMIAEKNPNDTNASLPEEHRGMMANLDFRNAVLKSEGEYITEIYMDNELLGSFPIYVKGVEQL
jgi:hypothetical protein